MTTSKVAKQAGVSQATVSRVLNHHPGVSSEKIRLVKEAMKKIDYQPHTARKPSNWNTMRYNTVALLVLGQNNMLRDYSSVFTKSMRSVSQALNARQINMIKVHIQNEDQLPPLIAAHQVDGVILAGEQISNSMQQKLEGLPTSWISSRHSDSGDVVLTGNELIGRMAAEYLLSRGHKRLAIINVFDGLSSVQISARQEFFDFIASRAGAEVEHLICKTPAAITPSTVIDYETTQRSVEHIVDKLLALKNRPTGLFVMMDFQVAMLYRVLDQRGLKPGSNLDIIGCDNEQAALLGLNPRPATIGIAAEAIGRRAVELLLSRIAHPHEESRMHVLVEPQLIPGEIPPPDIRC